MVDSKKLIFISGTGRSGTHLVGRSISSHPDITPRIEAPETFGLITRIATTQDFTFTLKTFAVKSLLRYRLNIIFRKSQNHLLEKSHPSLWMVDFLLKTFKSSKFIFVYRDLEPTVSSMLEHKGVRTWYKKLPLNQSNRFLGITDENRNEFQNYPIEVKCALRWKSHYDEIFRVKQKYPRDVFVIKYDDFLTTPDIILKDVSEFLDISNAFKPEAFNIESLDKWKDKLSANQIKKIRNAVQ